MKRCAAAGLQIYYKYTEGDIRFLQQRVVRAEMETKKAGQDLIHVRDMM